MAHRQPHIDRQGYRRSMSLQRDRSREDYPLRRGHSSRRSNSPGGMSTSSTSASSRYRYIAPHMKRPSRRGVPVCNTWKQGLVCEHGSSCQFDHHAPAEEVEPNQVRTMQILNRAIGNEYRFNVELRLIREEMLQHQLMLIDMMSRMRITNIRKFGDNEKPIRRSHSMTRLRKAPSTQF